MDSKVNDEPLEEALAKIERVRTWSPRLISKLENSIRTADDEELFRTNPLQWAGQKNVDEYEAVDLFLHSAKAGLFYMDWNIICPCCGKVLRSFRDLHGLQSQNVCPVCFRKDQATLDDYVQITFTLSPAVRMLRFHQPESLSLEEYCFNYLFEPSARMSGGLGPRQTFQLFKKHFSLFSPGEKITVEAEVAPGILSCVDIFSQQSFGLLTSSSSAGTGASANSAGAGTNANAMQETQKISVLLTDNGFEVQLPAMQPGEFNVGSYSYAGTIYPIRPGKLVIEFEQCATAQAALMVALLPIYGLTPDLQFPAGVDVEAMMAAGETHPEMQFSSPRLTAKRLFACQTFHDLFRAEVFQESEGFGVKDVTLLFTDLKSSTQLYQQIGDLNAFALVREHYGVLTKAILNQHGAVVKTIGDAIMATFNQPVEAVEAGLEMLKELHQLNQSSQQGDLILKIGIHRGAAISVTLNERIDYFGQTVNIASRVQGSAGGEEIYLTEGIYSSSGVQDLLQTQHCQTEAVQVQLKGIEEQLQVYKVTRAQ